MIVKEDEIQSHIPIVFVSIDGMDSHEAVKGKVAKKIENDLPMYYKPKDIIVLDEMPINSNQKIDYRALEQMAE